MTPSPPWSRGDAEREAKALFGNQALHRPAAAMAGCHERALDYIRQAPVIVLAAGAGKTSAAASRAGERAATPMLSLCQRGAKLREVMSFFGCAYQLRALKPSVLHPKRWATIYRLGRMAPSTLAQIIPEGRTGQDTWLRALTVWSDHCDRLSRDRWLQLEWAAVALRAVPRGQEETCTTVADLAREAARAQPRWGAVFDPRWTFEQAQAAAERWHRAMARERAEQTAAGKLGVGFSALVDYAPFPNEPITVAGYEFWPLRSCEDLYVEGAAMRHCVASYSGDVISGQARIFSVRRGGKRIATVEYAQPRIHEIAAIRDPAERRANLHKLVQVKGPCNSKPEPGVTGSAAALRAQIERRIAETGGLRAAFPGITATFSEERA